MVLVPLLFLFLHSELGLFTATDENHASHDYCNIVNSATVQRVKIATTDLLKLKIASPFCFHSFEERELTSLFLAVYEHKDFHYPQKTTKIYIHNNTFLI